MQVIAGIDLGGTNIKGGLFTTAGELLGKKEIPTQAAAGPRAVVVRIADLVRELVTEFGQGHTLAGVGVGAPGLHDFAQGECIFSPNLPGWRNVPVTTWLTELLGVPVKLDNDANLATLGEFWQGAGQGANNLLMLTLGTGVGGGLILNGQLFRGPDGTAGELGHMVIWLDGPACNCGNRGCLETLASATALLRLGREAGLPVKEAREVMQLAAAADPRAIEVVDRYISYLAVGVASLVNIFNPDLVLIGGGVVKAGEQLLAPLREKVARLALAVPAQRVKIKAAILGNDAGIYGAAALFGDKR